MKKTLVLILALVMMCGLAACNFGKPVPAPASIPSQAASTPADSSQDSESGITVGDIDFSSLLSGNGATDKIYGAMSPAEKQSIIDEAKKDGVDVSFGTDGSMTLVDPDGSTVVQKPDGTWSIKDSDGSESQFGGNWPDNEYTRLLPKPDFALLMASETENSFVVAFSGPTLEQIISYVSGVKAKGFTVDMQEENQEIMGLVAYSFTAFNAAGYRVEIFSSMGACTMEIFRP